MKHMKKINKLIIIMVLTVLSLSFVPVFANTTPPEINSGSGIVLDNTTNKILYDKNSTKQMYPASMTKILTAILAIENCNLDDKATASYEAIMSVPSGYSIAAIQVGETLSIKQLLEVLLVHSANDAANVLAEHVGGSIEGFSNMMNEKATQVGCKNSHFVNPSGKHDNNHYTTAYDMALIMKYCMKSETFRQLCLLKTCSLPAPIVNNQTITPQDRTFTTTDELILPNSNHYYKYAIAAKTGFTTEAKNCLVSVSDKDGFETICVVMGADSIGASYRFVDTISLYDYVYNTYAIKQLYKQNDVITQVLVTNGTSETKDLDLLISEDIIALVNQSDKIEDLSKPSISLNENIEAPISANEVVGKVSFTIEGVKYTTSLIASHTVEKSNYMILVYLVGGLIIVILLIILLIYNINRSKNKNKDSVIDENINKNDVEVNDNDNNVIESDIEEIEVSNKSDENDVVNEINDENDIIDINENGITEDVDKKDK